MERGEVWWAEHPRGQRHAVLLLSWDSGHDWRESVTVADVTTNQRYLDAEVQLTEDDGMPRPCVVNLDSLATIRRARLTRRVTALGPSRMAQVDQAVHVALGMPLPCHLQ